MIIRPMPGSCIVLDHPLEPLPLEVARIRRGVVKRFTGKFIKDGAHCLVGGRSRAPGCRLG